MIKSYSLVRLILETLLDEVLGLVGELDMVVPVHLAVADLLVIGVGDVAAEHVVQQDAQGPDGQTVRCVLSLLDPLWRRIDSGAAELPKHFVLLGPVIVETARAKVNQLCLHCLHVY